MFPKKVYISEEDAKIFWKKHLWPDTQIRLSSSIIYNTFPFEYDIKYHQGPKFFIGIEIDGKLVGINSGHQTGESFRSRGLIVIEEERGKGYGIELLRETIKEAKKFSPKFVWSIPKKTALTSYLKTGFKQTSDFFETETSPKNCFVIYELD